MKSRRQELGDAPGTSLCLLPGILAAPTASSSYPFEAALWGNQESGEPGMSESQSLEGAVGQPQSGDLQSCFHH